MTEAQPKSAAVLVALDRIRVDATQSRATLDGATVDEYAAAYKAGDQFPPVILFSDGSRLWMADGFHRYAGAKRAGRTEIEAEVREGTQRDALLFAVGCNDRHGLRRTAADKRHAVRLLLADPEWAKSSDRWIAETCRVGHPLVADVRDEIRAETHQHQRKRATGRNSSSTDQPRTGKDGKTRKPRARGSARTGADSPRLCDRCARIGVASCDKCRAAGATSGRQPGDEEPAKRAAKNGQPAYELKEFKRMVGDLYKQVDCVRVIYGLGNTPESEQLERSLSDWGASFEAWFRSASKTPAKE